MPAGRPAKYTTAISESICEAIRSGSNIHRLGQDKSFPSSTTINKWRRENEEFAANYARAREDRADWRSDNVDEIGVRLEAGAIDHNTARFLFDKEKWQAGNEKPAAYGPKTQLTGADGKGPVETKDVTEKPSETLKHLLDGIAGRKGE